MNGNDTLVSIIVPVYKIKEEYLIQCIESIVNQTYQNIEILLIDDGSPDHCGEICDQYAERYSTIKVIHKENEGVSIARNVGINESAGEYIMFVDADDWLELNCVETVLNEILLRNVDVVFFNFWEVFENNKINKHAKISESQYIDKNEFKKYQYSLITEHISKYNFCLLGPWGKIIKRQICTENQIKFPVGLKRSQDVIFNLILFEYLQSAYIIDYYGYYYRKHMDSNVHRYHPDISDTLINLIQECELFINSYHTEEQEFKRKLGFRAIMQMRIIENNLTLFPGRELSKKEIILISKSYLNTPIIKKYIAQSSFHDCKSTKELFRFIITKYQIFWLYYPYCKFLRSKKISKSTTV